MSQPPSENSIIMENLDCIRAKYEDLCRDLNMDRQTEEDAWKKYLEVSQRSSLEGDCVHWFCCVLYASCREFSTPTVGGGDTIVMGNCVPLNNLLRSCNMSIYDFTTKIKLWADMANLSHDFLRQIKELERKFSITFTLFKHYKNIFEQLFICPQNERKNTKFSSVNKLSFTKLYDLCWRLFLSAKNQKPTSTVDLVTSFHLLICCIDLIYINVLAEQRTDLINPHFKGLPKHWNTPDFDVDAVHAHCIIQDLCVITEAIPSEALSMKNNSWKTTIEAFFKANTIYGDQRMFLGIVSNQNIDRNLKSLNCAYEQYVLSVGEFDERILANYRLPNTGAESFEGEKTYTEQTQELKALIPDTPYTRQQFLPREENIMEPVANATNNVKQLQVIDSIVAPTDFVRQAGEGVISQIYNIIEHMSQQFYARFPIRAEAANRFQLAKSLYFYLLDNIVRAEIHAKPNIDLKRLLDQHVFNTTLIACCVELVLEAYNSQLKFPWILDCFSISAFQFHKIIEIVVLHHDNTLTRALIKHLNAIEETCLESLAWQRSSPVWDIIRRYAKPLPTWSEVYGDNVIPSSMVMRPPHSPMLNTAYETFNSTPGRRTPPQSSDSDAAKRDLFKAKESTTATSLTDKPTTSKQGEVNRHGGSLPIFLRKFYKLAWLRISKLCTELDLRDKIIQKKIWTLFEHSITDYSRLMQDRHLDQILMCAIYIYIRVGEVQDKTFTDIMKFYRKQPQATSSIYREVLIKTMPDAEPEYNDIIHFYNTVYVPDMTQFSLNFNERKKTQSDLLLSPHPQECQTLPKKLTHNHKLYVSPMQKNEVQQSPNQLTYEFCKSPAKDLQLMNDKVSGGKRFLPFGDDISIDQKRGRSEIPYYLKNLNRVLEDRKKEK